MFATAVDCANDGVVDEEGVGEDDAVGCFSFLVDLSLERAVVLFAELRAEVRRIRFNSISGHFSAFTNSRSNEELQIVREGLKTSHGEPHEERKRSQKSYSEQHCKDVEECHTLMDQSHMKNLIF